LEKPRNNGSQKVTSEGEKIKVGNDDLERNHRHCLGGEKGKSTYQGGPKKKKGRRIACPTGSSLRGIES